AIRLHQNILLRPGLAPEVRRRAQLALALDHRHSGLRQTAAECFEKVLAEEPEHRGAPLRYRQLLEGEGQSGRAAELQARLVALERSGAPVLAHLLAAHARALISASSEEALELARRAVELVPESADAQLALAQVIAATSGVKESSGGDAAAAI